MSESPGYGFLSACLIARDYIEESQLETSLGRLGNSFDTLFEVEPTRSLANAVTL
jgi:hypothetical protein